VRKNQIQRFLLKAREIDTNEPVLAENTQKKLFSSYNIIDKLKQNIIEHGYTT
jgi:hypothetical protein